ncbi:MgtC/SapB family protein [Salipiger mangrovisoli]|uniref:MgtC/SapB family protein n=1 Tax=Salipiger mangrovisoli TaxID=2865933 RepID=A0ABR9WYK1_9RHOB|nr:MgtC/SapB family protein [Salipiger mangrovisoli]MBE9636326.1 MgtC/SapB family protein [Salipiger mangrovisoli]
MTDIEIFQRLGLALAIGLLVGLERGWHERQAREGERLAGVRTFAIVGLLGGVAAWLVPLAGGMLLAAVLLALAALLVAGYWVGLQRGGDIGITTEIALLLVFVLGAASVLGEMAPAAAAAVVLALLLSMKARLHGWVARIEKIELSAVLKLALISVVVLPIMPDRDLGPGGVLNPYELWWAVVLVAGLSFVGYAAIRLGGAERGMLLSGAFGGLASSTSTTLALARVVRVQPALAPQAAAGAVIAGSVTFLRILALTRVFQPALFAELLLPMAAMAGVGLLGAAVLHRRNAGRQDAGRGIAGIANPLELGAALSFGAVLAVILLGVHYLKLWLGSEGVFAAAALSGVTDVDALTISVSRLVGADLSVFHGAVAIFIAVSVNSVVKGGISWFAGTRGMGLRVLPIYLAAILCGGLVLALAGGGAAALI